MDTDNNLSALFRDSVERGIMANVLVLMEVAGVFLGEYSATINDIRDSTWCSDMNMEVNIGTDHSKITILVPDTDGAHKAESIIMNVGRPHKGGMVKYTKGVIAKVIMTRATEGDAAVDLLTYLPAG